MGKVKEKEQAHREYKEAIARGDGAYLMDQQKDDPDVSINNPPTHTRPTRARPTGCVRLPFHLSPSNKVFKVTVGNLPPFATVLIKITYVTSH